ncbi:MAG: homoaconitate hydratase [Candidatus Thermoplasmatota archaeon]
MQDACLSPYNTLSIGDRQKGQRITVYDTTLRDGEQMPGLSFSLEDKVKIAQALCDAGLPEIEAGFPAVSEREASAVKTIAGMRTGAKVLALCRVCMEDVDRCADCDVDMALLFVATSDLHMKHKYGWSREEVIQRSVEAMEYARERGVRYSFSTEDSTRSRLDLLIELAKVADGLGAERIGLTDTVGCATPEAVAYLVSEVRRCTSKPISVHLHNDLGLALANALNALGAGATAFATTVNGIGERAGNLSLAEFAFASSFVMGAVHGIELSKMCALSELVSRISRIPVPPTKPLVGENAFAHESGIHVGAVLRCPLTYEPVAPGIVGNRRRLLMGKHTGRALVLRQIEEHGLSLPTQEMDAVLSEIKALGEENGSVSEREFWQIIERVRNAHGPP